MTYSELQKLDGVVEKPNMFPSGSVLTGTLPASWFKHGKLNPILSIVEDIRPFHSSMPHVYYIETDEIKLIIHTKNHKFVCIKDSCTYKSEDHMRSVKSSGYMYFTPKLTMEYKSTERVKHDNSEMEEPFMIMTFMLFTCIMSVTLWALSGWLLNILGVC